MRRFTGPALLLVLLALAGCGGGGDGTTRDASAPATAAIPADPDAATPPTGPTGATRPQPTEGTVVGLTRDVGDLTTVYAALLKAGIADELSGPGPFTFFAPTNETLAGLGVDGLAELLSSSKLKSVLLAHVVPGLIKPSEGQSLKTLAGTTLKLDGSRVGEGKLADPRPLVSDNGWVYELDGLAVEP